jgi:hypothetical protein
MRGIADELQNLDATNPIDRISQKKERLRFSHADVISFWYK